MARCAAILLGSGAGSVDALEASLKTLERDHSGVSPDVFVTLEPFAETARTWLTDNKSRVTKAYTSPYHVGWPIMLNTVIDQQIEQGEFEYDVVVVMMRGVTMGTQGWLRWAIEEITSERNEVVISLGGSESFETERGAINNGDGTWIVPRLWGGVIMPALELNQWRCVPYQPTRGTSWLDDLGDHCTIANRIKLYKPDLRCEYPEIAAQMTTFAGFDGGAVHG